MPSRIRAVYLNVFEYIMQEGTAESATGNTLTSCPINATLQRHLTSAIWDIVTTLKVATLALPLQFRDATNERS